jgi:hypothetical protein
MKRKIEKTEFQLYWIVADLNREVLFVPKQLKAQTALLRGGAARLYFRYKNRYPTFREEVI